VNERIGLGCENEGK